MERRVTQLPLKTLWRDHYELNAVRKRYLNSNAIREMLKEHAVYFVVADAGSGLQWIAPENCYKFWKEEVQAHIADHGTKFSLEDYKDGYAFIASEWTSEDDKPIIVLEKFH